MTLTAAQDTGAERQTREQLLGVLRRWGKSAFNCDIQDAVDGDIYDQADAGALSIARLRLDKGTARRRQVVEAKLRRAVRLGQDALANLNPEDIYEFDGEASCCICFDAPPSVKSAICGHKVVCETC